MHALSPLALPRPIVALCVLMMLVGAVLRFTFLDTKIYGNDEATTSLHVSGKTIAQYAAAMFDGRDRSANEILAYQTPDARHGIGDVVRSLAVEDPQHPPLYYVAERQWELVAGSSISARRFLAALFGVLAVLAAVWFGRELYTFAAGIICGALVALSPFAVAYSQVAREYSLWLALTFASSALFIRAVRAGGWIAWGLYGVATIAGLYTDALFLLVVMAHALSVALPFSRRRKAALEYAVCMIVVVAAYAPWLITLLDGYRHGAVTNNLYLSAGLSLRSFALKWIFNIGTLFYDADYVYPKTALAMVPGLFALALCFTACARRIRQSPALGIIFSLSIVTLLALLVPDLLHHEQRSTASRYLVPLWAACYAALGVGLAAGFASEKPAMRAGSLGVVVFAAICGLSSFAVSSRHQTWWVDGGTAAVGPIARAIQHTADPTVVYRATWGPGSKSSEIWDFTVVMLADIVPPSTRFVQFGASMPFTLPRVAGSVLVLDPTDAVVDTLRNSGYSAMRVAGGEVTAPSADITALRRNVARKRRTTTTGNLSPVPSLWALRTR